MARFQRMHPVPNVGYRKYRDYVRSDFEERCAYCLIKELFAGGPESFELDHFRPKSLFPESEFDFYNLYYSCHPCNNIKHDKWPSRRLQDQGKVFVDLCVEDFEAHFQEQPDGSWKGITPAAAYTIDELRLNRSHLVKLRKLIAQLSFLEEFARGEVNDYTN
jgi:uncharacterized protein (TIGR02646 family)